MRHLSSSNQFRFWPLREPDRLWNIASFDPHPSPGRPHSTIAAAELVLPPSNPSRCLARWVIFGGVGAMKGERFVPSEFTELVN